MPFLARACETIERSQGECGQYTVGLLQAGQKAGAAATVKAANSMPETSVGAYFPACYNALAGNRAQALQLLRRSVDLGFIDAAFADGPGFASLRGDPEFEALVAEVKRIQAQGSGTLRVKTQLTMLRFNGLVNRIGGPTDAGELVLV